MQQTQRLGLPGLLPAHGVCFPSPFAALAGALRRLWLPVQPGQHEQFNPGPAWSHRLCLAGPQQHSSWQGRDPQSQHPTSGKSKHMETHPFPIPAGSPSSPTPSRSAHTSKAPLSLPYLSIPSTSLPVPALPLPPPHLSPLAPFLLQELSFWCQGQNCLCCSGHWSCSNVSLLLSIFYFMNFPFPLLLDSFKVQSGSFM